jgi:phosphatidylserine/phosphatidylglycerophosphate/cardiolipin synthase-like enzyme
LLATALGCTPHGSSDGEGSDPPLLHDPDGSIRLLLHAPTGTGPQPDCVAELCTSLAGILDGAEKTVDFALYGVRGQPRIVEAMKQAQGRGVLVRGVVDRDADGLNYYADTEAFVQALGHVRDDGKVDERRAKEAKRTVYPKPRCAAPAGHQGPVQCLAYDLGDRCLLAAHSSRDALDEGAAIMHDKFVVVDSQVVWTGSTNVSDTCSGGYNANLVTVIDSRRIAAGYLGELDQMYEQGRYHEDKRSAGLMRVAVGDAELELLFSPQDSPIRERVRPLVKQARERIDIAVFYFTHKLLTADLIDAHQRGVEIRVILDATAAANGFTKHELLRAVGIPVKVEDWGGKMHMKSAMIDGHTVITGSMNWTTAGDDTNDENVVIIHSEALAEQYSEFYEQIWAGIDDRWLHENPDPESRDSGTSCTDGIDNDYDGVADAEDPGCGDQPPPLLPLPPWYIVDKGGRMTCEPEMLRAVEPHASDRGQTAAPAPASATAPSRATASERYGE